MTNYILRRKGMGVTSTPIIADICGAKVISTETELPPEDAEYVIRWGTITKFKQGADTKVINKSSAIQTSADKKIFRDILQKEGLCPKTWFSLDEFINEMYGSSFDTQKPVQKLLIRPAIHSRSEGMFLCTGLYEAKKAIQDIGKEYYISEFVQKKRELRVFVIQGKVAWVIEKHPKSENDVSWGCVEEGKFDYVYWSDWPTPVIHNAIRAVNLAGLDFGAVDVIMDNERSYVLEVNTAPWLSPYYAKAIGKCFKYLLSGKGTENELSENPTWKEFIHPAMI